jgi:hypothetical protein
VHQRAASGQWHRGLGGRSEVGGLEGEDYGRAAAGAQGERVQSASSQVGRRRDDRSESALSHVAASQGREPRPLAAPKPRPSTGVAASRYQAQRGLIVHTGVGKLGGKLGGKLLDSPGPSMWDTQQTPDSAVSLPRANAAYLEQ